MRNPRKTSWFSWGLVLGVVGSLTLGAVAALVLSLVLPPTPPAEHFPVLVRPCPSTQVSYDPVVIVIDDKSVSLLCNDPTILEGK